MHVPNFIMLFWPDIELILVSTSIFGTWNVWWSIVVICGSFVAEDFLRSKLEWSCGYWRQVFVLQDFAARCLEVLGLVGFAVSVKPLVSMGMILLANIRISITSLQDFITFSRPPKVKKWWSVPQIIGNHKSQDFILRLKILTLQFFHWNNIPRTYQLLVI